MKQYESAFSTSKVDMIVEDPPCFFSTSDAGHPNLTDFIFTSEDIEEACKELSAESAAGPDGVPAKLLKECRTSISQPLSLLWRSSLDKGVIATDLLLLLICPVHKGGLRSIPKNFRPVALTSHLIKVFERVMRKALVRHMQENNLMSDGQHGFRSLRSTLTQLLAHFDAVLDALENGSSGYDSIYLDFQRRSTKWIMVFCCTNYELWGSVGRWGSGWRNFSAIDTKWWLVMDINPTNPLSPVGSHRGRSWARFCS